LASIAYKLLVRQLALLVRSYQISIDKTRCSLAQHKKKEIQYSKIVKAAKVRVQFQLKKGKFKYENVLIYNELIYFSIPYSTIFQLIIGRKVKTMFRFYEQIEN
jgi:hypothetical protein